MVEFSTFDYVKMAYSVGLVIFSICIVTALMWAEKTSISEDSSPIVAFLAMWIGILWMTMVEGGQCSMVGLPPIDRELYKESHPITYSICSLGHKGDNLNRYLMGRQFMVIFINFTIGLAGAPVEDAEVFGLPDWLTAIFLGSGIAMVLTNVNIGQLTSQCNASHCMLDYINTHFMTFTLYVTLAIEFTGVMHVCYVIRDCFYWASGKPVVSAEPPKAGFTLFFYWIRVLFSVCVLGFAIAVTLAAIFDDKTAVWDGVPPIASVLLLLFFMVIIGMLEGMQIAFFAVCKLPEAERAKSPWAQKTVDLLFKNDGRNLPGFMVGRQMTVTLCFFIVGRILSVDVDMDAEGHTTSDNIFGVPDNFQTFLGMGFLGAILTTVLASITWQLVAGAFPLTFLSFPLVYILLNCALALEFTGLCHASWFFAMIHKRIAGFQRDEFYVGTPEERAAMGKKDDEESVASHAHVGTAFVNDETKMANKTKTVSNDENA
uniref:Silicon transporter n=1 Tax=Amphora coffeiformis TaxID=265554 RepID=A0A7S3KVX3_9STRA|mmetsp:Transcript_4246/g.8645  ORF Transcript_4246/g.8645 Transcript_4246/m.8645 type:complete len:488 (+) Transcript_4246:77-1540(+)|eukprot:scaffold1064_cov85-Amphora_coffeaeformis.AAC.11